MEDVLGVTCNFETKCAWEWDEIVVDGFQVVTGANLTESNRTGMMPGPSADMKNDANGKSTYPLFYFFLFKINTISIFLKVIFCIYV